MAVHLKFLLILTVLTGIGSITTVSKVSVKAGDSITIPCLYESQYINNVKYLCKGYYWSSCTYEVKTNKANDLEKFSIADDKSQRIFTVTIKDLTREDTYYWCIVEVDGGPDVGERLQLSVTGGTPLLYVDRQEITGFKGDEVNIACYYRNFRKMKWCKLGSSCVTTLSGSIDGTRVTIRSSGQTFFTVTMSGLTTESSGWYWCVNGDFQMPVHVTVIDRPTTTTPTTTRGLTTLSTTPNTIHPDGAITTVKTGQYGASFDIKSLIISLSLLISVVMMALFIWFMLKRHKLTKAESSAPTTAGEEVTYCKVKHKRKTSSQAQEDVTYCNVGYVRKTPVQVAAEDKDVTYSTLAQQHQKI